MHVTMLGADGTVARLVRAELERRGHELAVLPADAAERGAVERALAPALTDVLVVVAGPVELAADVATPAAMTAGIPVVDASCSQAHLRHLHDRWGSAVAGPTLVPAAGSAFLLGDLLGAVAADAAPGTDEVQVAYALPRRADLLGAWTRGLRRTAVAALAAGGVALSGGAIVEERAGEARRLAWFPRPVGPHHAAGIPGGEALSLPRHVPGLRTVRTYLAVPSLLAEVLQAGARSLERTGDDGLAARLLARLPAPDDDRRRELRWACVAEAPARNGTARAWAYGTDPYAFAATALVLVAERVAAGGVSGGLRVPGELGDPADLLDELTLRSGARWSVARP